MKTLIALLLTLASATSFAADYLVLAPTREESALLERLAVAHGTRARFEVNAQTGRPLVTLRFTYHKGTSGRKKVTTKLLREVQSLSYMNGELFFGDLHCGSVEQPNGNCELVVLHDFRPFGTDRYSVVLRTP